MSAGVLKAELHVHLEGTIVPSLAARLARRNGLALPDDLLAGPGAEAGYVFSDFGHFLEQYDHVAGLIRTPQDYRDVVFDYLGRCAAQGTIYVEMIASPRHAEAAGMSQASHREGLFAGIDDAREAFGVEGRIIVSIVRQHGVELAERTATEAAASPHPYVVGLNIAGDEAAYPPAPFTHAFAVAADAGLGCSVHAGEWAGPESVRAALALPGVTRLSHGVRAVEDPALLAELAELGTVLEVCPTSNVVLGVYPDFATHPFGLLRDAGVAVTLGSDDPPFFGATLGGEYEVARTHFGLDDDALVGLTATAIEAAFCDEKTKARLRERLAPRRGSG